MGYTIDLEVRAKVEEPLAELISLGRILNLKVALQRRHDDPKQAMWKRQKMGFCHGLSGSGWLNAAKVLKESKR